jgi:hypothetical protein
MAIPFRSRTVQRIVALEARLGKQTNLMWNPHFVGTRCAAPLLNTQNGEQIAKYVSEKACYNDGLTYIKKAYD